jgi:hypothetical protein
MDKVELRTPLSLTKGTYWGSGGDSLPGRKLMLTIRAETPEDIPTIHHINTAAFGQANEADLVNALLTAA